MTTKRSRSSRITRILLKSFLSILIFIVVLFLLLLTPPVQRLLKSKVENYLEKKLQVTVEVGRISFDLFGNISLQEMYVEDRRGDTLLHGGTVTAKVNYFKLFGNDIRIKSLALSDITTFLSRASEDTNFNFQFIADAFTPAPDSTSQTSVLAAELQSIRLSNVTIHYRDMVSGTQLQIFSGELMTAFFSKDLNKNDYSVPFFVAKDMRVFMKQVKPLVEPGPIAQDIEEAIEPFPIQLVLGKVRLDNIKVQYDNDVSAMYANIHAGTLEAIPKLINLQQRQIHLSSFNFTGSAVNIRMEKKEQVAILAKEIEQEIVAQQYAGWDIRADKIQLDKNSFQFDNNTQAVQGYGIDFAHLLTKDLSLGIDDLVYNKDSLGLTITHGSMSEQSGFILEQLRGKILYAHNESSATGLLIKTPGTEIKNAVTIRYASQEELVSHLERSVLFADIDNSYIQVKDILYFAPFLRKQKAFANPDNVWQLNLQSKGTLDRMVINNLRFNGLYNTQIDASGTLTGLSNPKVAGGNFIIRNLHTTQTDISLLTGQRLSTAAIQIPEDIYLSGTLAGNSGNLQTNLNLRTSSGALSLNGRFNNINSVNQLNYDAIVQTTNLNLGAILQQPGQFGILSGNFKVKGTGINKDDAKLVFAGSVTTIDVNQYRYRNLNLQGKVENATFTLEADINDPNADANFIVNGKLSGPASYTINGMIDSVKLQALNLSSGPFIARGKIDGKIFNITSDNIEADILISKGLFVSGIHRLPLDTIQLKSGRNDSVNYISLRSDIANADISGQYRLSELGNIIQGSIAPYFSMDNAAKVIPTSGTHNFKFNMGLNYSPVFNSLVPGLVSFSTITAAGSFVAGEGLTANANIPSLIYQGNEFDQLTITAASADSGLQINATAASIKGAGMSLYNTRVDALALNNNLGFTVATDDQRGVTKYRLAGKVTPGLENIYKISLNPDSLLLNYELWSIAAGNQISISPTVLRADNFVLQKDNQQLSVSNADLKAGSLDVKLINFRLATITGFLQDSISADGVLHGELVLTNLLQTPSFTGRLRVDDFSMQKDTIGNIDLQVTAGDGNRHITTASISGRGNDVTMTGYFIPGNDISTDLTINIRQLQLATLEGALAKALTDASGSINGTARITGNLSKPDITGDIGFTDASFIPTVLGTRFRIGGQKIKLSNEGIVFDKFVVEDSTGNQLVLNGKALTSNFINYDLDLSVKATNFQLLNSVKGPGKIYYGKLNVTADLQVNGTEVQPIVDGRITVNEGTSLSLVVPQTDQGVAERNGIIEFVDMDAPENDSLFLTSYDSLNNIGPLGFDLAATIEIKKEAIFNVIIDEANGDLLNVQGEAQLSAGIDPSGKITLAGNYVLEKGSYELSFNFLRRRFDIQQGSKITWTGEPTSGLLDITAVYLANTAPLDLVSSQLTSDINRSIFLQKLPFEVKLKLTGELLKPIIDFDIDLPEKNYGVSNDIVTAVQSKLNLMRQDEGEINKQVFSLLLLNRFVGENPFESGGDGFSFDSYAKQSVSKLLTEQLNQLAAGLVSGVDLNFDVVSADDYTTGSRQGRTDLNIGLSKRLLSDRLKITVGSNFQLEGPQNKGQQNNNIAGNVAADYQISKDGRYVLRFYRQNEYQGIVDGYIIETGVSFIFSVDYERFMQIFRRKKRSTSPVTQNKIEL